MCEVEEGRAGEERRRREKKVVGIGGERKRGRKRRGRGKRNGGENSKSMHVPTSLIQLVAHTHTLGLSHEGTPYLQREVIRHSLSDGVGPLFGGKPSHVNIAFIVEPIVEGL